MLCAVQLHAGIEHKVTEKIFPIQDQDENVVAYYSMTQDQDNLYKIIFKLYRRALEHATTPADTKAAQIAEITAELPETYAGQLKKFNVKTARLTTEDALFYSVLLSLDLYFKKLFPHLDLDQSIEALKKQLGAKRMFLTFVQDEESLESELKAFHQDLIVLKNSF